MGLSGERQGGEGGASRLIALSQRSEGSPSVHGALRARARGVLKKRAVPCDLLLLLNVYAPQSVNCDGMKSMSEGGCAVSALPAKKQESHTRTGVVIASSGSGLLLLLQELQNTPPQA